MTKEETIKIMAMLGAFYGAGKSNPEVMAEGWYLILSPYDYDISCKAVLDFVTNDKREYATFPTVGCIVDAIKSAMAREEAPIKEVVRAISYGWGYDQLSKDAKELITPLRYDEWLKMDAEAFANNAGKYTLALKDRKKSITGETK